MTRPEYLHALADARRIIDVFARAPMTFAASPGKVSRAFQRWNSAVDEERAEATALSVVPDPPPQVCRPSKSSRGFRCPITR